jgi:hypothetical protein
MIMKGLPLANLALLMAMYSKIPVGRMMLMITIMEKSRKMTFQSTPNSGPSENASSWLTMPRTIIRAAA